MRGFISCSFLYSFFTASGAGLEAFFSSTGHLVVAVCNKKEYTSVTVPVCQLSDQTWVRFLNVFLRQSKTKLVPKRFKFPSQNKLGDISDNKKDMNFGPQRVFLRPCSFC